MIFATCATIALQLASASGGEAFVLSGQCGPLVISKAYAKPVTINATGATIGGLVVKKDAGNIVIRGGKIVASGGAFAAGPTGYAALVHGKLVTLAYVTFTSANRGLVLDSASSVTIAYNHFYRIGQDAIIASQTVQAHIVGNKFSETIGKLSTCTVGGVVSYAVPQRNCTGTWIDGYHCDAVQMRNADTDWLIENNNVTGKTQGIDQMDAPTDAPLARIMIRKNTVATDGYHHITLGMNCIACTIRDNTVTRAPGSTIKAVIIAGAAMRCGNTAQDDRIHDAPCTF